MTAAVQELMNSFEALSKTEQHEAVAEILRRIPYEGTLSNAMLEEIADSTFQSLDAKEAADRAKS